MEFEDRVTIATPEGVDLELTLAGVGSRFASALVDYLIQVVIVTAAGLVLSLGAGVSPDAGGWATAVFTLVIFVLFVGYDITFEVLASGRTPGKRMNGLRVVRDQGEPITFLASAVRNTLRIVDFLPSVYLVGAISVLVTRRNQRLGDLVAGTLVVRERRGDSGARPWYRRAAPLPPPAASADTSAVTQDELLAVVSFLDRRYDLAPGARGQIASELAARLRPKVAGAIVSLDDERFLEELAAARRRE